MEQPLMPGQKGYSIFMEKAVIAEKLTFAYPAQDERKVSVPVFSDLNLEVEQGSFVAVLGRNGCGKSTLAKQFNAILLPSGGSVRVYGMDTSNEDLLLEVRRRVGMVFQNPDNQIIAAVVEDDIAFGPENLGVPPEEIRHRVDAALETVHMEKYRTFAPHLLSGGQKQRIAIAGALAMETSCLVLDEPTAMLDPQGRAEVLSTVERLHREKGITVVYITHFMEEAAVADRIIVMEKGRIVGEGTPREIFARPERLRKWNLDVPLAAEIAAKLRERGFRLPEGIYENEELVGALVCLASGRKAMAGGQRCP